MLVLQNNSPLSHAGKASVIPSMVVLIKEAYRDFGGFWPSVTLGNSLGRADLMCV